MNYIEIDFNDVEGYKELSEDSKVYFKEVYRLHNSAQGIDYKQDWVPVKVTEDKACLKVVFKNNEWLHYFKNGTWG